MDRPIIIIRDFLNVKKAELRNASTIIERKTFGEIYDLSFFYPKYLIDANGNAIYDDYLKVQFDPKVDEIQAERIIEFNSNLYIIKNVSPKRADDGHMGFQVQCKLKPIELTYKQVYSLVLNAPLRTPPRADEALLETLTYPYQKTFGKVLTASSNTVQINTASSDDYTGKKIAIIEGLGFGQDRRIISYVVGTKTATVSPAFTITPNTTSIARIHNSKYTLGTVDSSLLNDGVDINRGFEFREISILQAISEIKDRFGGYLTYDTTYDSTYSEYETEVNLVLASAYNNVEFRYGKNMESVTMEIDSTIGGYTRVSPVGRDNLRINTVATSQRTDDTPTGSLLYDEHVLGQNDIVNFKYYLAQGYSLTSCEENFIKDFKFVNDGYDDASELFKGAKEKLEELSIPKITYKTTVIDLAKLTEFSYLEFDVGQTIRVIDTEMGININATLFHKETNWDEPENASIEIANFYDNLGDFLSKIIKQNQNFTQDKKLYGKTTSVVVADEATSRNWRYADYVIPEDGRYTADEVIQKAIDDLTLGGEVRLLDGDYLLNETIQMNDNVKITGVGNATRIVPNLNGVPLAIRSTGKDNTNISNLFIDYKRDTDGVTKLAHFNNAIGYYSGSKNVLIENIKFDYVDNNVFIAIDCEDVTFQGCNITPEDIELDGSDIIDLKDCTNASIFGNTLSGLLGSFRYINIEQLNGQILGEFFIEDNYIKTTVDSRGSGNGLGFITIDGSTDGALINIKNNTIIANTVGERYAWAITLQESDKVRVHNNDILGQFRYGINVGDCGNCEVKQNTIEIANYDTTPTFTVAGITIGGGSANPANDNVIDSNVVKVGSIYTTDTFLQYGIHVETYANNTLVINNDLKNSGSVASLQDDGTGTNTFGGNNKLV